MSKNFVTLAFLIALPFFIACGSMKGGGGPGGGGDGPGGGGGPRGQGRGPQKSVTDEFDEAQKAQPAQGLPASQAAIPGAAEGFNNGAGFGFNGNSPFATREPGIGADTAPPVPNGSNAQTPATTSPTHGGTTPDIGIEATQKRPVETTERPASKDEGLGESKDEKARRKTSSGFTGLINGFRDLATTNNPFKGMFDQPKKKEAKKEDSKE